ncbi:hypothetical protein ON010_g14037 [Phytophthora cinnamomi]|nr:hypothetical protein ON010_g14037 [Phytophthora cinnamomi]
MGEHHQRVRDFTHRFNTDYGDGNREVAKEGGASPSRNASVYLGDVAHLFGDSSRGTSTRNGSILFPNILVRGETMREIPAASRLDELARPMTTEDREFMQLERRLRYASPRKRPVTQPATSRASSSCAELEAQYLSRVLPFSGIVDLQDQLLYASFDQQQRKESTNHPPDDDWVEDSKTSALLNGLRRLPPEDSDFDCDVRKRVSSTHRDKNVYQFHGQKECFSTKRIQSLPGSCVRVRGMKSMEVKWTVSTIWRGVKSYELGADGVSAWSLPYKG